MALERGGGRLRGVWAWETPGAQGGKGKKREKKGDVKYRS